MGSIFHNSFDFLVPVLLLRISVITVVLYVLLKSFSNRVTVMINYVKHYINFTIVVSNSSVNTNVI